MVIGATGRRALTSALVAALGDAGLVTGRGEKPDAGGWQGAEGQSPFVGYVVVHPISGGVADGPVDNWVADTQFVFQVSCHAATEEQCSGLVDAVGPVVFGLLDARFDGWRVMHIDLDMEGGATRMDTVQPAQWWGFPRYRIWLTPAPEDV